MRDRFFFFVKIYLNHYGDSYQAETLSKIWHTIIKAIFNYCQLILSKNILFLRWISFENSF